jgi:hypothetical protein
MPSRFHYHTAFHKHGQIIRVSGLSAWRYFGTLSPPGTDLLLLEHDLPSESLYSRQALEQTPLASEFGVEELVLYPHAASPSVASS